MKPLSGLDNLFLSLEQGNQYMHVGGLGIYDPVSAPGGKVRFKQVLDFFSGRTHLSKAFSRRLVIPPMGIDRPSWIEDGNVDIEYHVRHIALPQPGDWRQLMIQVARIHARPLDRTKPLWEAYIIEGLDNIPGIAKGSFALYIKFHHAAVDGEAGAALVKAIHSLSPEPKADEKTLRTIITDRDPTLIELYARAVGNRGKQLFDASALLASLSSRVAEAGTEFVVSGKAKELGQQLLKTRNADYLELGQKLLGKGKAGAGGKDGGGSSKSRFDNKVSAHRVVDAVGYTLADCKTIRSHVDDVTINDIFLAACGGAVRTYLEGKKEKQKRTLFAMMPMTTRGAVKDMDAGNQIGLAPVALRTDIADPLERLLAVKRGAGQSKAASSAIGKDLPAKLVQIMPAVVSKRIMEQSLFSLCSTMVSNVRGPDVPLYMAGAQMQLFLPISILFDHVGLTITGFSYNGTLWVCFVACREMIPDPAHFAICLTDSFNDMVAAAVNSSKAPAPVPATLPVRAVKAARPKTKRAAKQIPLVVKPIDPSKAVAKPTRTKKAKARR